MRVAIIGAGLAGLAAAEVLLARGLRPVVFDKSRGIGGRLATRRVEGLAFDHGAQYMTAAGPAFAEWLGAAAAGGAAAHWPAVSTPERARWVGTPEMKAPLRPLAAHVDLRLSVAVQAAQAQAGGWWVRWDGGEERVDRVISTAPAPQAARLLAAVPGMAAALAPVRMAPCWALMVGFDAGLDAADALREPDADLSWIARNSGKPGRPVGEAWVVHAAAGWSARHLEEPAEAVCQRMLAMLADRLGPLPETVFAATHRWRYALATDPLGAPYAADPSGTVLAGGDWALGARCEAAFDSGRAMAEAVLASA